MSFLYKRGKIWWYYWYEGKVQKGKSTETENPVKAEVFKEDEDKKRKSIQTGEPIPDARWQIFKKEYLEYSKSRKSEETYKVDIRVLDAFEKSVSPAYLENIGQKTLEQYLGGVSLATSKGNANLHYRHLKTAFRKAVAWKHMKESPLAGVSQFKTEDRPPRFLSKDEIKNLLLAAKSSRPYAYLMVMVFLYTGMRRDEARLLRWENIDFKQGWIRVLGKGKKERHIPLHHALKPLLWAKKGAGYVFGGVEPLNFWAIRSLFVGLYKAAGIKNAHVHTLRHTFGSHAVMGGMDLPTLKEIMGHSSIQTTMIYAHLARPHVQKSMVNYQFQ